jgi:uncharacterized protein
MNTRKNRGFLLGLMLAFNSLLFLQPVRCMTMELPITDNANIFNETQKEILINKLNTYKEQTTNQIAILTVKNLGVESLEEYAHKVYNEVKLGQKDKNNGVLILFVLKERKVRIEVGYGLEEHLTDAFCSNIISTMVPLFVKGDYYAGLMEGATSIMNEIDAGNNTNTVNNENGPTEDKYSFIVTIVIGLFALIVLVFLYFFAVRSYYITTENLALNQKYITKVYCGDYSLSAFFITFYRGGLALGFGIIGLAISVLIPVLIICYPLETYIKIPLQNYLFPAFILFLLFKFFIFPVLYVWIYLRKPIRLSWKFTEEDKEFLKKNSDSSGDDGISGGGGASGDW